MTERVEYPDLDRLVMLRWKIDRIIGQRVFWTEKRDGSNVSVWLKDGVMQVSTRNQDDADASVKNILASTGLTTRLEGLLAANPGFVVFGELIRMGKGPTKVEGMRSKTEFPVFDIFDRDVKRFLPFDRVMDVCQEWLVPTVSLLYSDICRDRQSLFDEAENMVKWARGNSREGVVCKCYEPVVDSTNAVHWLFFKEKYDMPSLPKEPKEQGPRKDPLPDSEINGAIQKALDELGGEKFGDVQIAMPVVARLVGIEAKKHDMEAPRNVYGYYLAFLKEIVAPNV